MSNMDRKTDNFLLCPGEACPLRHSCLRFQEWLNNEDDEAPEMNPDYQEGECYAYEQKKYYGG